MNAQEAIARHKFSCPACGGEAVWNPDKKALVCEYCGTTSPADIELKPDGELDIKEHDLMEAMRAIPDSERGWKAQKTEVKCQSCHAISVFDESKVSQRCEFCGSTALVPYESIKEVFSPESLLEFKISEPEVRDSVKRWFKRLWFVPGSLVKKGLIDTVHGVYLPYWTFDAQVHADWTADAGHYYYVSEHYRDSKGVSRTRQVRKVRWVPAAGQLDHFFDDVLIPASKGVDAGLLAKVGHFPTSQLKPYHSGYLSGWVVERYQIDLGAAASNARSRMDETLRGMCGSAVPGDTYRNLFVHSQYSGQTFKHVLLPIWLLSYQFRGKTYQLIANGYTGNIAGQRPWSIYKITLLVLAILVVVAAIFWGGGHDTTTVTSNFNYQP